MYLNSIIIFGKHSQDWMEALGADAEVWKLLQKDKSVVHVVSKEEFPLINQNTIVIPLLEDHIFDCPKKSLCLIPSERALAILRDKLQFSNYVERQKLTSYCPLKYKDLNAVEFPCVLKRTNLNAGYGIRLVSSSEDLSTELKDVTFLNHPFILQKFVPGNIEYVTHCICKNGKILWDVTYKYQLVDKNNMQSPKTLLKVATSDNFLKVARRFLEPLLFSGPCNIDYKFNDQGEIVIFEINPRLGGSLLRPEYLSDLKAALECIIETTTTPKLGFLGLFIGRLTRQIWSLLRWLEGHK